MKINNQYWKNELTPPYSPCENDELYYKNNLIQGTTLLLGCTHKLIKYSSYQMDIDPWYKANTVIVKDWIHNSDFYDNIIGDGVFNFTKTLTDKVLKMASKFSKNLIIRCFNQKLEKMIIADYFPNIENFIIKPTNYDNFGLYSFYIWKF